MAIEVSLNCPACGGAVKVEEGRTVLNCQYCGSALYIEGDAGVITIAFKNNMNKDQASSLSQGWFRKGWKARDLSSKGKVLEAYPIYLPFWSTNIRVVGWICGYEERTHSDSKGHTHTERIPKEELILHDYPISEIACDPGDLGISHLRNFTGERALEDFTMIPTYEATTSKDQAMDHMKAEAVTNARRESNVPHITFERLHVLPRPMSMMYYPIWVVRYSYNENMYFYTMDGVTGSVISGRAPGDSLYQALAITAGTSIGGIIAGLGIASAVPEFAIGGLVFGSIIFFLMYNFFRHGSEIIEGDFDDKKYGVKGVKNILQVADALKLLPFDLRR